MSKIANMINELCPNGVEFKKLRDNFEIKTGKGITKKDAMNGGIYPFTELPAENIRQQKVVICRITSANGSKTLPKSLTTLCFRA